MNIKNSTLARAVWWWWRWWGDGNGEYQVLPTPLVQKSSSSPRAHTFNNPPHTIHVIPETEPAKHTHARAQLTRHKRWRFYNDDDNDTTPSHPYQRMLRHIITTYFGQNKLLQMSIYIFTIIRMHQAHLLSIHSRRQSKNLVPENGYKHHEYWDILDKSCFQKSKNKKR